MGTFIQLMHENDLKAASESLAQAFMYDPLQSYVFPDEKERRQKSPDHFEAILRYGLMYGEVYMSQKAEGELFGCVQKKPR